jgi:hypothetical protein
MKNSLIACLAFGLAASCLPAVARTWQSKDGRFSIEAELTAVNDGKAQLKKADGKTLAVPLDSLAPGDRDYAERFRSWKSGKFSIFAEYLDCRDGKVELGGTGGKKIRIGLDKLCPEDQSWVKAHQGEAEPEPSPGTSKPLDDKALEGLGPQNVALKLVRLDPPKGHGKSVKPAQSYLAQTIPQQFHHQAKGGQATEQLYGRQAQFPKIVTKEPKYLAPLPLKDVANIGGQDYAFVLDVTDAKAKGYNKLYFDLNHNGDLTDDKPVIAKDVEADAKKSSSQSIFPRVDMKLDGKDGPEEYGFILNVACQTVGDIQLADANLYSAIMREGYLTQGGRKTHLVLLDRNSNGRFADILSVFHAGDRPYLNQGDLLLINPNPKSLAAGDVSGKDQYFLNRTLCLGKKYFHLEVTPSGDCLKLSPIDLALGSVRNASPSYCAWLTSEEYGVMMLQGTKGQKLPLPAGDWKMVSYSASVTPSGSSSTSGLMASFPDSCEGFTVKKGNTVDLPFGGPYKTKVTAKKDNDKVSLRLDIVGAGGEKCTSLVVNGKSPSGPLFVIKNADGKEVYKGKFEFG